MSYIPGVLVYVRQGDKVLLMHRNKEPNLGLWIAPGGKVEPGESPYETGCREMLEETGLHVSNLQLRGFCTEVSPFPEWMWFLFIFVTEHFHGELLADEREGNLSWVSLDTYFNELSIPQADRIFAPRILNGSTEDMFQAKFTYDQDLKLVNWQAY
ncbi:MAG: 8-oxo-dGTP diphosphatase [Anaerolineae bacterium]|nr:8-oxo-dGTP diphosphatase [Anaerolineae bacterium]